MFWLILTGKHYVKYFEVNFRNKGGFLKYIAIAPLMILGGLAVVVINFGAAVIGGEQRAVWLARAVGCDNLIMRTPFRTLTAQPEICVGGETDSLVRPF